MMELLFGALHFMFGPFNPDDDCAFADSCEYVDTQWCASDCPMRKTPEKTH